MLKFLLIVCLIFCLLFQVRILEKWERQNETLFWGTVIFVYATFTILDVKGNQISASPIETSSQILAAETIARGGSNGKPFLQNKLRKKTKFNIVLHRRLEKHFPDFPSRVNYQKRQEQFYKSALKKKRQIERLKLIEKDSYYTSQELDAMAYFYGTGFYKNEQDSKQKPNIFDTRQTFLKKMHDPQVRRNFLENFK